MIFALELYNSEVSWKGGWKCFFSIFFLKSSENVEVFNAIM